MPTQFILALGILGFLLALRFIERRSTTGRIRTLMTGEQTPESRQQVHELLAQDAAKETQRRARLWDEAHTSIRSARELRRLLEADLNGKQQVRQHLANRPNTADAVHQLNLDCQELAKQLETIDAQLRQLRA
jgi:hypothetical protein